MTLGASLQTHVERARTARLWCPEEQRDVWSLRARVALRTRSLRGVPASAALRVRGHRELAVEPAMTVRRAVLEDAARGLPRVLLRVDEFPHARAHDDPVRYGSAAYIRFHDVLASAGVPYLLAVLPRVATDYLTPGGSDGEALDDGEVTMLSRLREDGVGFGLHGHTHRTRDPRPRHHSALGGMGPGELDQALTGAEAILAEHDIHPRVFIPPFNRFDAAQYPILARRYDVVCGGPESVRTMGLQPSPCWIGDAVYLPCYAPVYGTAAMAATAVDELIAAEAAVWLPVTLHPGWEDEDLVGLRRLAQRLASIAYPWEAFLSEVARSAAE